MDSKKLLGIILDIGVEMIQSGAETHRVEDSLYRLSAAYGFASPNFWVIPTNIQATVIDHDGEYITQIRYIRNMDINFNRLDRLNELSRQACAHCPHAAELEQRLAAIINSKKRSALMGYLGGLLAGAGFCVFFGGSFEDAFIASIVSLAITLLGNRLRRWEHNIFLLNFITSIATECLILLSVRVNTGNNVESITLGVIMLLISALGTTNGIRDLISQDTLSGVINITSSLAGALGIALGIALPFYVAGNISTDITMAQSSPGILFELIGCIIGCAGFALWFHVPRRTLITCIIGAALTWVGYSIAIHIGFDSFFSVVAATTLCGVFSQLMARFTKTPATIHMTICSFPLIPGSALYYTMYGIVIREKALFIKSGISLLLTCFGIVLGSLIIKLVLDLLQRNSQRI